LGKDETIMRICPQYETDALLRVVNIDRYDDRHIAKTNLLGSYDELLDFSRKHLPAPFFLEDDKRLNLREIITREMIANVLIHREFTSLDKSMFVIERERMYTSNPCNPVHDGRITPENVRPRAKNPIIAGFFREIGRADRLGSGIRNLYKYCKDYGGGDPVFTEGDHFVISVSLKKLDAVRFPFENSSVDGVAQAGDAEKPHIGPEKVHIEQGKVHIDSEKVHIGPDKVHIESRVAALGFNQPTVEHVRHLYTSLGCECVFGRSEICRLTDLKERGASKLIDLMLRSRLIDTVKGQGKGKYRFRNCSEEA